MIKLNALITNISYYCGISYLFRKIFSSKGKFVIMFHGVSKEKNPNLPIDIQPHLDINQFNFILSWIKNSFQILDPDTFMTSQKNGVLLTFDDGFLNNFSNVLPVLETYDAPALFFITTENIEFPEKWLHFVTDKLKNYGINKTDLSRDIRKDLFDGISKNNLIKMSSNPLVTIGSHSKTHPLLSQCSNEDLNAEIVRSKKYLESLIKRPVRFFAYPSGDYNQLVLDKVSNSGYEAAFGIDKIENLGRNKFEIPRIGIYSSSRPYLAAKFSGLYQSPIKHLK